MDIIKYIDPTIGNVGEVKDNQKCHGGGKTHPGACTPGGMTQFSPDTVSGGDNGTGYNYCDNTIEGFSINHMSGIGWYGDLGNLQIMPVTGKTDLRSGTNAEMPFKKGTLGWRSEFSRENEKAEAGYYSVFLDRYKIKAELTVTLRTGLACFTYPENDESGLIFNFSRRIGGKADYQVIDIVNDHRIEGEIRCTPAGGGFGRGHGNISYNLYFACELSKPMEAYRFFSNEEYAEDGLKHFESEDAGLLARFKTEKDEKVLLRIGISYVDLKGAINNLETECPDFDFEKVKTETQDTWRNALSVVKTESKDDTDLTLFYTCLYHAVLDPRTAADADGRCRLANGEVIKADYVYRTMFSGWDVYRSEFPLLTIIDPEMVNDEVNSLITIADKANSAFPRWELMGIGANCMVGDSGTIVVADAYLKGIRNFDTEKAYQIAAAACKCETTLNGKPFKSLRENFKKCKEHAYVERRLSDTLEFLLSDYVMYEWAKSLGKTEDAEYFKGRFSRYKENYNPKKGFMGPRNKFGRFIREKDEYDDDGCVESNIFQQSWFVPYDVEGLFDLFGRERALSLLERFFEKADFSALWNDDYNHSNEPCHNITHYFNYLGLPHRTQYWTRRVQKEAYRKGAYGFCGNEDVGQLSAWYVLSAMGFAQVCPGNGVYQVNTPLFKKVEVKLEPKYHSCKTADTFTIECDQDPLDFPYIKAMFLNGVKQDRTYINYDEITSGGKLYFELSKSHVD